MATISATTNNTSMMLQIAAKGLSASDSSQSTANTNYAQLLAQSGTSNTKQSIWGSPSNKNSNNTSHLYTSSAADNASSFITALTENRSAYNDLIKSYNQTSSMFKTEFNSTMSDLKNSASALKSLNFNVKGTTDAETESNVKSALKTITNFVSDYNDSISLFNDYSDVSKRMTNLADLFSDNSARSSGLNKIGITVDAETSKLKVDTEKLSAALKDSPSNVEYQLGRYGLAGKAESNISVAKTQESYLFPSVNDMLGSSLANQQAAYTGNALLAMNNYTNVGNFLNMFF